MSELFRSEALAHRAQSYTGEVVIRQPISLSIFTMMIMLIMVAMGLLLAFGDYARKVEVSGYLMPDKGVIKIYAPALGEMRALAVKNGDQVLSGQTLFSISTEVKANLQDRSANQQLIDQLLTDEALIKQKIASESSVYELEANNLTQLSQNLELEITQITLQVNTQRMKMDLAKSEMEKLQQLVDQKMITEDQFTNAKFRYLNSKGVLESTEQLKITKTEQLYRVNNQLSQLPDKHQFRLAELHNELSVIKQRIIELKDRQSYMIKSPVNGEITSLLASKGQIVGLSKPILSVIPEGSLLYAELLLPSRSIGFVQTGQSVLLKFDAFPYQRYGLYRGSIIDISGTVVSSDEIALSMPNPKEPFYIVKVELDKQFVEAYGRRFLLQSGMRVSADIILDRRSLIEWLIEPILSLRGGVFSHG